MDRSFQREVQRRGGRRAAPLEDAHDAFRLEGEPQARGRGFGRGARRAKQRDPGRPAFGRDGEAAQLVAARAAEPAEERMAVA